MTDAAILYVQYSCDLEDYVKDNERIGMLVATISLLAIVGFSFYIYYLKNQSSLNYKLWDNSTTTTADFTVMVKFSRNCWEDWKTNPGAKSFKSYVKEQMIEQLKDKDRVEGFKDKIELDICTVFLAYNNGDIIKKLGERG